MFFPSTRKLTINGGAFTDVQGNVNHYYTDPSQRAEQGALYTFTGTCELGDERVFCPYTRYHAASKCDLW
jgi:hypothetical protein